MSEIIFEVREDEVGGGFTASALGLGIHSEGETLEELRTNVREAVDCYFDETMEAPRILKSIGVHHKMTVEELVNALKL